jgi:hypothetical protein
MPTSVLWPFLELKPAFHQLRVVIQEIGRENEHGDEYDPRKKPRLPKFQFAGWNEEHCGGRSKNNHESGNDL